MHMLNNLPSITCQALQSHYCVDFSVVSDSAVLRGQGFLLSIKERQKGE